jgi:long-chain-fatty-acyl-CoA reductase
MGDEVRLPVLVAGARIDDAAEFHRVEYEGDLKVVLPVPSYDAMAKAVSTDRGLLNRLPADEILTFFDEVSKAWADPANPWRRRALELGPRVTGYHPDIIARDVNFVAGCMVRHELYDLLETDLGDPGVLDDWTRYKGIYYRAWPKGLAAHVMVGNVPLAGFFTIVRSLATKNITIAKASRRDVVLPQCLAQCMFDVDPTHPIVRALTTTYWEAESDVEKLVLEAANIVTVWGRADSIESIKRRLRYGTDLIEFGPKRSFAVFLEGVDDWDRAGLWLGFDVINYNQEACFSTQEAFVLGDPMALAEALATWLEHFGRNVGFVARTPDSDAHVQRCRMEARVEGWRVIAPSGTDWTIIITDGPVELSEHPLARTVYIHPCKDFSEVLATVDGNVQGVTVEPFGRAWQVADALTGQGVARILPLGRTARMREGFIHDGFHPMRRMVRWSIVERGAEGISRFGVRRPEDSVPAYQRWATGQQTWDEARRMPQYRRFHDRKPRCGPAPGTGLLGTPPTGSGSS